MPLYTIIVEEVWDETNVYAGSTVIEAESEEGARELYDNGLVDIDNWDIINGDIHSSEVVSVNIEEYES